MPTIPLPPLSELPEDIRRYMDVVQKDFGWATVPNMSRTLAVDPELFRLSRSFSAYQNTLRSALGRATAELIGTCVSALNACDY